jgi:hypothetical protein
MAEIDQRKKQSGKKKKHTRLFYLKRLKKTLLFFNQDFESLIKLFEKQFKIAENRVEQKRVKKNNNLK